ncbi:Transcriptional regulatory protein DegU [Botrimarina colliarenosi]|uniref:Transcriptional regulatory protein DegU n=1 Tax=Botrimarina colliarenosi TaxID=2528001 RepID=A0A5C6A6S4_9BACT|nr:response regulator transcription factor [Botrimarina colliarenosi]TWT94043.1 Transcriptional regulatory protein DegU [Botrimarina colliarenosi]
MPTTVLLADDHPVVRAGLRAWFADSPIQIIGEAEDGSQAYRLVEELRPQVLLSEVLLPQIDGLQCLGRLRDAGLETPCLFYTGHTNPTYAARASALGAAGFVAKSADRDELAAALQTVAAGGVCWPSELVRRLSGPIANGSPSGVASPLTAREDEVLKQLAFGLSNKEIAQALGISYETVKEHVQHILRKLNVADRTQAAVWAVRQGLA